MTVRGGRWRAERITELIANEKYVGDALFQKTYTDSSFIRHRNHGVCNQYLITEHHEPIISHEVFDRANEIIKLRRFQAKNPLHRIGQLYSVVLQNITACSMKYVEDDSLKAAFLVMINKLIFGRKYVLTPLPVISIVLSSYAYSVNIRHSIQYWRYIPNANYHSIRSAFHFYLLCIWFVKMSTYRMQNLR